ncbi:B3GNTL1 [Symbiodinium sp. CCMP2592]|nr:B3GNTL1 [Symbiodinium sp. CCMP2592]
MTDGAGKAPEVSIILPVYNAEEFLDEAFHSILEQSFLQKGGHLEVSIFDDGSHDRSAEIVEQWRRQLTEAYPDTLRFTVGTNTARLEAARRGERRNEAYAKEDGSQLPAAAEEAASCALCRRRAPFEELQAKKASSKKDEKLYCKTCCALSKEEWQQKRREVYTEKMSRNQGYGGSASTALPANGVPCGIGFACNSAVQQSSGEFLCRFDADDVMYPERIQLQIEALRALPSEHQDRTLVGTGFVRMPEDATPRYTGWLNGMTDDQLTSQRFREVTLLHPTWMYHRRIWERVGGYTQDTAVGEDIVFFHKHLEADGLLLRVPRPLLRYRCHPGQRSWRLPRRAVQAAKVAAFQRQILVVEPWNRGFGVLGAGRDARDFVKALSDDARKLVTEFYEVDKNKWGKWISVAQADGSLFHMPIVPQQWLRTPFVVCVALERGFGVIEAIKRDAPAAREGVDYFHLV